MLFLFQSTMSQSIPLSVLIVGSGVFGLSAAYSLAQNSKFQKTVITVLDRSAFPAPDAASIDSSRIIRTDYADYAYAALGRDALARWRKEWGADGRYTESGLALVLDPEGAADGGGREYLKKSLENVQRLGLKLDGKDVSVLEGEDQIKKVVSTMGGVSGVRGYVNWTSGWADAEEGMKYLYGLVTKIGQVQFRTAEIKHLLFAGDTVEGAELASGEKVTADLTVLATGAWTPKFIDTRGICSATGQVLAYIDITQEEQDRLERNPVLLNESNGLFIIPPRNRILKVARHGYGYANPQAIPHPERSSEEITVSLPRTKQDDPDLSIPQEGMDCCRQFLKQCMPDFADRPWAHTRICWYTDTPKGDWLIDYHPSYKNLFVATGGSGHGYKFLPVVGDRIVDVILDEPRDELGKELQAKWKWPKEKFHHDHVWTSDWRGGVKGMVLEEELQKGGG